LNDPHDISPLLFAIRLDCGPHAATGGAFSDAKCTKMLRGTQFTMQYVKASKKRVRAPAGNDNGVNSGKENCSVLLLVILARQLARRYITSRRSPVANTIARMSRCNVMVYWHRFLGRESTFVSG
jgi:hypothetical protein